MLGNAIEEPIEEEEEPAEYESTIGIEGNFPFECRAEDERGSVYSTAEAEETTKTETPKYQDWRKTPRTAADFRRPSTPSSGNESLYYKEWLNQYREEERLAELRKEFNDQEAQTGRSLDLSSPKVPTMFPQVRDNVWSFNTTYWGIEDVRRHWPLHKNQLEYLLFPSHYPYLNLPSRYGRYHFHWHHAAAIPEKLYTRRLGQTIGTNLLKLKIKCYQISKLILCDMLAYFGWFDALTRLMFIRMLGEYIRRQKHLKMVCLENARLERIEGVVLLCALSENSSRSIQQLHIWKMFKFGHSPPLMDDLSVEGLRCEVKYPKIWTRRHFQEILNQFTNLTHLSLNYAYVANRKGDAILDLGSIRNGKLQELRLLCLEEERPLKTNPGYGTGGWTITDGVWRKIAEDCPNLKVKFIFINMPNYENIILFLSKSIPMNHVFISSGVDLRFQSPWDVDSTLLELRNWYAKTLEVLSLHLWHHRDLLDFVLKKKLLIEFPNLLKFEFIGVLEDPETLETFCSDLSTGNFKLQNLLFWVEESYTDRGKRRSMKTRVAEIKNKYKSSFLKLQIDADIAVYPS